MQVCCKTLKCVWISFIKRWCEFLSSSFLLSALTSAQLYAPPPSPTLPQLFPTLPCAFRARHVPPLVTCRATPGGSWQSHAAPSGGALRSDLRPRETREDVLPVGSRVRRWFRGARSCLHQRQEVGRKLDEVSPEARRGGNGSFYLRRGCRRRKKKEEEEEAPAAAASVTKRI